MSQGDKGGKAGPEDKKPPAPKGPPRPVDKGQIVYLKLKELHPFHTFGAHPFKVIDSQPRIKELTASIKEQGVFTPATVRPEKDGNGYEIIAGHCRHRASELAGLTEIPCIVREMDDHEAVREMRDSNKQRGEPLPTELAALLALEVEDIKHQGGRLEGVAAGDRGKRSVEIVGEAHGMNYKKVMRYIRLNHLIPEFQSLVDGLTPQAKKMGFMPAVELSYDNIISWADMYDTASLEAKRMIVNCLIKRVDIYRDYKIHVDFAIDLEQFGMGTEDIIAIPAA